MSESRVLCVESQLVLISCLHHSFHRYFVENGVLQITNVSHRDQGLFTCVARTPVDRDAASALLMVLGELT